MSSTAQGARARLPGSERRAQIASAARKVALDAGLVGVTLRAVAAEVGVAPALVAHYEPSMEDLTARTFGSIVGEELVEVGRLVAREPDVRARMAVLLSTLLEPRRSDVTLVWVQAWALGGRSDRLAAEVRRQMDAWESFIATVIEGTRPGAAQRDAAECRSLARQVLGMIDGLNAHALVDWRDDDDRLALLVRSVEALLRLPAGSLSCSASSVEAGPGG